MLLLHGEFISTIRDITSLCIFNMIQYLQRHSFGFPDNNATVAAVLHVPKTNHFVVAKLLVLNENSVFIIYLYLMF
jgi:hypothetical protein